MIHAFNFTCHRDMDLSILMRTTLMDQCKPLGRIHRYNTDTEERFKGYGNGSGWPASMLKLNAMREIVGYGTVKDDDYILSVDSDVVFTSPEVFRYVKQYGIIGIKHRPDFSTKFGPWSHMSGALIFIRGDVAHEMVKLSDEVLNGIRFNHFKPYNLTENEDVVLSYLAKYVGADYFDLGSVPGLSSGDFESDIKKLIEVNYLQGKLTIGFPGSDPFYSSPMRSFYHLNYCPTQFLGEPVDGKWMIPSILKQKGIEL